jgi:site-specific recombinase XerD
MAKKTNDWILTKDKYLSEEEASRLRKKMEASAIVANARGNKQAIRDWMIIDLALSTGLRVMEVAALKHGDIFIRRGESELIVRCGKGGKMGRVSIGSKLKAHLKEYIEWKQELGLPVGKDDFLFISQRGGKFTTRGLQLLFKQALQTAGLDTSYGFHAMRHTYAVMLYKASGWNLRLVQKELRHSSVKTTQVYADVSDEDAEKAVNGLWAD